MIKTAFVVKLRQVTETGSAENEIGGEEEDTRCWMWDKQKEVVIERLLENFYR